MANRPTATPVVVVDADGHGDWMVYSPVSPLAINPNRMRQPTTRHDATMGQRRAVTPTRVQRAVEDDDWPMAMSGHEAKPLSIASLAQNPTTRRHGG
jgi:hypothetical protein